MFEYQYLSLGGLDEDFVGIIALHFAGDWLAARYQLDDNLLAPELGDEMRAGLLGCWLGGWLFFFSHAFSFLPFIPTNIFLDCRP